MTRRTRQTIPKSDWHQSFNVSGSPRQTSSEPFSLLYVGSWSLRKGCDILAKAVRQVAGIQLRHVGAIGDCEFPVGDPQFIHHDAIPQPELAALYSEADLFVLASREEGLSAVLMQALASGLPLVCTDRTGGADLAHTPALAARITLVPHDDVDKLKACAIARWRNRWRGGEKLPRLSETDRETLSWTAYARRYDNELLAGISPRSPGSLMMARRALEIQRNYYVERLINMMRSTNTIETSMTRLRVHDGDDRLFFSGMGSVLDVGSGTGFALLKLERKNAPTLELSASNHRQHGGLSGTLRA